MPFIRSQAQRCLHFMKRDLVRYISCYRQELPEETGRLNIYSASSLRDFSMFSRGLFKAGFCKEHIMWQALLSM